MPKKDTETSVRVEWMDLNTIQPHPQNPKAHDVPAIVTSMRRFGFRGAIIIDEKTGLTNEGHGRVLALKQIRSEDPKNPPKHVKVVRGRWYVPAVRGQAFDSELEAQAFLIASNRLGELGGWDNEKLMELLGNLRKELVMVEDLGFSINQITKIEHDLAQAREHGARDAPESFAEVDEDKTTTACPKCGYAIIAE